MSHWNCREKRHLPSALQTKFIVFNTTYINLRWQNLDIFSFTSDRFPPYPHVSSPLFFIVRISQLGKCSCIFLINNWKSVCVEPWKWFAVKSEVLRIACCMCRDHTQARESERERESRNVLWLLSDYKESLSSCSTHCCDLIWFLSDAEMLHYQVGSKLCLNQLQWDPLRPNCHSGPSGRGWRRMEKQRGWQEWEKDTIGWGGGWLEFVLISGVWGHMRAWR